MFDDINRLVITGTMTKNPELSDAKSGTKVGKLSIAVNSSRKKGEEWVQEVSFFNVTCFGKLAENLAKFTQKGSRIVVDGKIKQDTWEKDGQKRSAVSIIADDIKFPPKSKSGGTVAGNDASQAPSDDASGDVPF